MSELMNCAQFFHTNTNINSSEMFCESSKAMGKILFTFKGLI